MMIDRQFSRVCVQTLYVCVGFFENVSGYLRADDSCCSDWQQRQKLSDQVNVKKGTCVWKRKKEIFQNDPAGRQTGGSRETGIVMMPLSATPHALAFKFSHADRFSFWSTTALLCPAQAKPMQASGQPSRVSCPAAHLDCSDRLTSSRSCARSCGPGHKPKQNKSQRQLDEAKLNHSSYTKGNTYTAGQYFCLGEGVRILLRRVKLDIQGVR